MKTQIILSSLLLLQACANINEPPAALAPSPEFAPVYPLSSNVTRPVTGGIYSLTSSDDGMTFTLDPGIRISNAALGVRQLAQLADLAVVGAVDLHAGDIGAVGTGQQHGVALGVLELDHTGLHAILVLDHLVGDHVGRIKLHLAGGVESLGHLLEGAARLGQAQGLFVALALHLVEQVGELAKGLGIELAKAGIVVNQ